MIPAEAGNLTSQPLATQAEASSSAEATDFFPSVEAKISRGRALAQENKPHSGCLQRAYCKRKNES